MAPQAKSVTKRNSDKPRQQSGGLKAYLFVYNFIQLLGWIYVMYLFINFYTSQQYRRMKLWDYVFKPVAFFQTLAMLEILHILLGFVKSSVFVTTMQISFRIINTFGVFSLIPGTMDTVGVPMTIFAWCGAEITRYLFHICKEINFVPYFVTWIRYSAFMLLIPVGISGELLGQYTIQSMYANKWTIFIPQVNITVGYRHFIIGMMASTGIGVFVVFRHMMTQRKKALGSSSSTPKKKMK